jgi:hypothetical protein
MLSGFGLVFLGHAPQLAAGLRSAREPHSASWVALKGRDAVEPFGEVCHHAGRLCISVVY